MSVRSRSFRSKNHRHKRIKHNLYKYGGIGLGVLSIFFSLVVFVRADFLKVEVVDITGTEIIDTDIVENMTQHELSQKSLWLFPKNNFVLFPRKLTEEKIRKQFSTVANVSVSFDGLKKLIVEVEEYKPTYLWCGSLSRESCYFMDERGYIFTESAGFSSGVLFTYYGLVQAENPVGSTYLPAEKFAELNSFVESLKLLSVTPVGLNALGEDDFEAHLSGGAKIIFSAREPFLTTFENLETVFAEQNRLEPDFLQKLEYVDARFTSKVFVKMK